MNQHSSVLYANEYVIIIFSCFYQNDFQKSWTLKLPWQASRVANSILLAQTSTGNSTPTISSSSSSQI